MVNCINDILFPLFFQGKYLTGKGGSPISQAYKPEDYIYEKKYTCPCCDKDFVNFTVKASKVRVVSSDTDLRQRYEPVDMMYYDTILCPLCGYAASASMFGKLTEKQAQLVMGNVSGRFKPRAYAIPYTPKDAIERNKLALFSSMVKNAKNSEKAGLCLRLSWLHRDADDADGDVLYTKRALDAFVAAYQNENPPICGMDGPTTAYLIGELYRRTGDYSQALKWIGGVIIDNSAKQSLKNRALALRDMINASRS